MNKEDLLDECHGAYFEHDFERLIELCDEILKTDPENQNAIGYKGIAYCFSNQNEKALEILKNGIRLHPDNYYINNNIAMVYYDLGDYEKSLKYCEKGLEIKDFDWLRENKELILQLLIFLQKNRIITNPFIFFHIYLKNLLYFNGQLLIICKIRRTVYGIKSS